MRQGFAIFLIIGIIAALWLVNTGRWRAFASAWQAALRSTSQPGGYASGAYQTNVPSGQAMSTPTSGSGGGQNTYGNIIGALTGGDTGAAVAPLFGG